MDMIDRLRELSMRIPKLEEDGLVTTEEGAKNALVMPFIQALGYDVFNPTEVTPELTADVGTKRGEKVDYAILREGKPIIIIECKGFGADLTEAHASQLYRYFSVTQTRFGVLTNGITYMFFSDLDEPNLMDKRPFFVFDLMDIREATVGALKQFSSSAFDQDKIVSTANTLKYRRAIKQFMAAQFVEPSNAFVRLSLDDAYKGNFTQSVIDRFTPIVKDALRGFLNEQVGRRLKRAAASEEEQPEEAVEEEEVEAPKVITTDEEIYAYFVVKSIVRGVIDVQRVTMRDYQSFCNILVDDTTHQNLCKLRFDAKQKSIGILNEAKEETQNPIDDVDDIYNYAEQLKARALYFVE